MAGIFCRHLSLFQAGPFRRYYHAKWRGEERKEKVDGVVCCGVPRKIRWVEERGRGLLPMPVFVRYPYPYFPPFQGVVVTQLRFLAVRPDETPPSFRSQRRQAGKKQRILRNWGSDVKSIRWKIAELENPFRSVLQTILTFVPYMRIFTYIQALVFLLFLDFKLCLSMNLF